MIKKYIINTLDAMNIVFLCYYKENNKNMLKCNK